MASPMKNSGVQWIGMIPSGWKTFSAFQLFKRVDCKNEGVKERNLLSLSYGKIKRKDIESTDGLLPESFEGYNVIEAGDIVLRLTDLQNDQKSLRVGFSRERGIVTSAYLTIRNNSDNVPEYLYYYWHTFDICKGFYGLGAGVRQGLNWEGLKNLRLALPSPSVQQRIVCLLNKKCAAIDDVLVKTQESIEEYKKLKQAVITEAVTKGVRGKRPMKDSGIDWIGQIPKEWTTSRINRIGKTSSGATPLRSNEKKYFDGADIGWVRSLDLNDSLVYDSDEKITQEAVDSSACSIMPVDTICMAMYGGSGTIGKCGLIKKAMTTNQAVCSIVCNKLIVLPLFLLYQLICIKPYWMIFAVGTRKDPNINQEIVMKMPIVIPTLSEQREIADYLDKKCAAIDSLIEKKQQFIDELTAYKKSLIYEYVTGKRECLSKGK